MRTRLVNADDVDLDFLAAVLEGDLCRQWRFQQANRGNDERSVPVACFPSSRPKGLCKMPVERVDCSVPFKIKSYSPMIGSWLEDFTSRSDRFERMLVMPGRCLRTFSIKRL